MKTYKLRPETIIDIIETIPSEKIDVCMSELTEVIRQAKFSYDLLKVFDSNAKAVLPELIWQDDGKGEVSVTHSVGRETFLKTSKTMKEDGENPNGRPFPV